MTALVSHVPVMFWDLRFNLFDSRCSVAFIVQPLSRHSVFDWVISIKVIGNALSERCR